MKQPFAHTSAYIGSNERTRLHGRTLWLARGIWAVAMLFVFTLLVVSWWTAVQVDLFGDWGQHSRQVDAAMFRMFAGNPFLFTNWLVASSLLNQAVFILLGLLLYRHKSDDWLVIYASIMLIATGVGFSPPLIALPIINPAWRLPTALLQTLVFGSLICFWYLFPNGRFTPKWTRYLATIWILFALSWLVFPVLNPHQGGSPLGLLAFVVFSWTGITAQVYRYQTVADVEERQQTKWVITGFMATAVMFGILVILFAIGLNIQAVGWLHLLTALIGLTAVLIPLTIAIALFKYRLWQIDILINRTAVYGALTAVIILLYILVVGALGVLFRSGGNWLLGIVATGLIAILFDPLRQWFQRRVNRLMYGQRDEPLTLLTRFGQRLAQAVEPETILPTAVQTIAYSLKLPYTAITLEQDGQPQTVASFPPTHPITPPPAHLLILPLIYQSQPVGHLLVAHRDGETSFTPREMRLLHEMARQTAVAAHTVRLHRELRQTRQQLVTAQAEERRRVSRALGDGLGAQLAALLIQTDTTRQDLQTNPDTAVAEIQSLKTGTQTAVQTVRALVQSLTNR